MFDPLLQMFGAAKARTAVVDPHQFMGARLTASAATQRRCLFRGDLQDRC